MAASGSSRPTLVVLGAVNVDLVVRGAALPRAGETVVGGVYGRHQGGKGGNQAVAAARALLGGPAEGSVVFVGAVGDDDLGREALAALSAEGIDLGSTRVVDGVATGVALIVVDDTGENQIAVAPGANARFRPSDVDAALTNLEAGSIVLASLEIPIDTVRRAAERCRALGATFVLNPAPTVFGAADLLPFASVVTPNEGELAALAGAAAGAGALARRHPGLRVIVTRGTEGATLTDERGERSFPASTVGVTDTTGAGDAFNGALAAAILEGRPIEEAVARAVGAAGRSVTQSGAREGMPTREEIDRALR
jgi:ribokinase